MMKIFLILGLLYSGQAFAQRSGHLQPTENYDYRVDALKGVKWIIEVESTSTYSSDGIPKALSSRVKIEKRAGNRSLDFYKVNISKYPNEDGVSFIDIDSLKVPLFLVVSRSSKLPGRQRVIHLIAPGCTKPLDSVVAQIEDTSQIQIDTGVKDFMITFPSPDGPAKKTWTAPADSSKLCQQKWR